MTEQTYDNATHYLQCSHAIGSNERHYVMPCHVLKTMPDGRIKVRVWGRMFWAEKEKSRIRYVKPHLVCQRYEAVS